MAYSDAVISRAKARLREARLQHEEEQALRRAQIYADAPRLREIDQALRKTAARVMAAAFRRGEDPAQAIAGLREENLALQREREWILDSLDLEPDSLDEMPLCETCGGTGYVGAVMCDCLKELCRQEQRNELSFLLDCGYDRFESFRLHYYSDEPDPDYDISPRENMKQVLSSCQTYAKTFTKSAGSLLLSGGTGLGKTFLSACIARQVAENGYSVIYDTAVNVFAEFEIAKFGGSGEENRTRTEKYLACDLLILDDLGTEMATQFITSALYTLVNTRLMGGFPTIISTNLSIDEIRRRYSPQIFSRLLGSYDYLMFFGEDIRLQKRNSG